MMPLLLGAPLGACKLKIMAMRNKISPDRVQIPPAQIPSICAHISKMNLLTLALAKHSLRKLNERVTAPPTHPKL